MPPPFVVTATFLDSSAAKSVRSTLDEWPFTRTAIYVLEAWVTQASKQHADMRREAILDAALRVFARKGTEGATIAEIASEAGLGAGTIYRYFDSKEQLLHAVFAAASTRNQEMFLTAIESTSSPLLALREAGRMAWVEPLDRDHFLAEIQMVLRNAQDPEDFGADLLQPRRQIKWLIKSMVEQAQQMGEIDPTIDAGHLATIIEACTTGIMLLKLGPDDFDAEATFDLFVEMVMRLGRPPD